MFSTLRKGVWTASTIEIVKIKRRILFKKHFFICTEESVPAVFKYLDMTKWNLAPIFEWNKMLFLKSHLGKLFFFCGNYFSILHAPVVSAVICAHRRKSDCIPLKNLSEWWCIISCGGWKMAMEENVCQCAETMRQCLMAGMLHPVCLGQGPLGPLLCSPPNPKAREEPGRNYEVLARELAWRPLIIHSKEWI